jgi:hypothetical protein
MLVMVVMFSGIFSAASNAELSVILFYVDITGQTVDSRYYACGNSGVAGPFASGGSAIEWRDEFLNTTAPPISRASTDPGVCGGPVLLHDLAKGWHR